jgi:hypothetical protein
MTLDISPPEATFDKLCGFSPILNEIKKSTSSQPAFLKILLFSNPSNSYSLKIISNCTLSNIRSNKESLMFIDKHYSLVFMRINQIHI